MANKRPKPEEIVSKLRQVEVLMGQGMSRLDAIRKIGVVEQTCYRWRKQYGGMGWGCWQITRAAGICEERGRRPRNNLRPRSYCRRDRGTYTRAVFLWITQRRSCRVLVETQGPRSEMRYGNQHVWPRRG